MILESGELESGGELLGERPGDGWTWFALGEQPPRLTVRYGGRGRKADVTYAVERFNAVGGLGIRLVKLTPGTDPDDRSHDVILPPLPHSSVCSCRGFARWNRCKHGAALRACEERGLLDPPAVETKTDRPDDPDELIDVRPPHPDGPPPDGPKHPRYSEIVVPF